MKERFEELKTRLGRIDDLRHASAIMEWDQQVMMPPGGATVRAEQLATLDEVAHELFVADETGRLLDDLRAYEESLEPDSDEASLIRVARRDWEKARRVPAELSAELTRTSSAGMEAWVEARARSDYASFKPWLDRTLELKQRYIDCFEGYDEPYDVLLDDFEPGMKTAEVRTVFDELKAELVPLIAEAASDEEPPFLRGPFDEAAQEAFSLRIMRAFGYTDESFRFDRTVHPFCSEAGPRDIRLTSRYSESDLTSLFTAMHECGHGLYEHGVSLTLERTPLAGGVSMALHESQSRLWENVVGRSLPFWEHFFPALQETFPSQLGEVELEDWVRAVNRVRPSLIRVDADEATYGLHIIARFELEQELLSGELPTDDLPEAWAERYHRYLGLDVPDDGRGVLQDVHWASGGFGYFPTYALGNVVSLQIWEKAREALPDLDDRMRAGEFGTLHEWLRDNLYAHGRKFTPRETLERLVGTGIEAGPYLRYLHEKYGAPAAA